ncbi:MAG: hypothetical protein KC483_04280 [Nitrosarchaeum sp.]|nr:hypothetical protein [Nitrosarchaeum sp.]
MDKKKQQFFMTLDNSVHVKLRKMASKRGVTLQEFIRAVIIPEWLMQNKMKNPS